MCGLRIIPGPKADQGKPWILTTAEKNTHWKWNEKEKKSNNNIHLVHEIRFGHWELKKNIYYKQIALSSLNFSSSDKYSLSLCINFCSLSLFRSHIWVGGDVVNCRLLFRSFDYVVGKLICNAHYIVHTLKICHFPEREKKMLFGSVRLLLSICHNGLHSLISIRQE